MSLSKGVSFTLSGTDALSNVLKEFPIKVQGTILDRAVSAGATVLKKQVKDNIKSKGLVKTGNLLSSVSTRKVKGTHGVYEIYTNYKGSHAHLLEFGTGPRHLKTPRAININGRWVTVTSTGSGPAKPFFRPAIDQSKMKVYNKIMLNLAKNMAKHAAKLSGKYGGMSKTYRRKIAQ